MHTDRAAKGPASTSVRCRRSFTSPARRYAPAVPADADQPRSLRQQRYAVVGVLGEGAQGQTLDAVDKLHGRPVTIKRFHVRGASSWKDVEMAEREARVLASLSHPRLPRYVEHFEEEGVLYLVTEKLEGESLLSLRKRGVRLSEADVLHLLTNLSDTLDYLHSRAPAVIHRDIKPGNVLRLADGSFALIDFGSVRDKLRPEGGSTVVGTFGYMAPEQFQGRALAASDVYAVGATVLSVMTGCEPEELPHQGLALDVEAALGKAASPELKRVLGQMLEPDPDRRPNRIEPLLEDLRFATKRRQAKRKQNEATWTAANRGPHRRRGHGRKRRGRGRGPWMLNAIVTWLVLTALWALVLGAEAIATVVLRLLVPLVLQIIAAVTGRRHPRAEHATEQMYAWLTGVLHQVQSNMRQAITEQRASERPPAQGPRVRVSDPAEPKVRVVEPDEEEQQEEEVASEHRREGL